MRSRKWGIQDSSCSTVPTLSFGYRSKTPLKIMSLRDIRTQWSALARKELRTRLRSSSAKSCPGPGRLVAMCMPIGISRSCAAAHRGSYMGLSYPFPSGGYTVTIPPASPFLAQRSSSLDAPLHIVAVDHGDALEALRLRGGELGKPVVASPEN